MNQRFLMEMEETVSRSRNPMVSIQVDNPTSYLKPCGYVHQAVGCYCGMCE